MYNGQSHLTYAKETQKIAKVKAEKEQKVQEKKVATLKRKAEKADVTLDALEKKLEKA